jgi:erythronate-4-phosphate dehydrogenase
MNLTICRDSEWNEIYCVYLCLMLTLVIDDHIPFIKGVFEPYAEVIYAPGGRIEQDIARQADGLIIRTRTNCTADLLSGTRIKFIATATIGFDHIDTEYCKSEGISWHHAPGCNSSSVRQYMASALVTLASKFNFSLKNKIIGIIGAGHVGNKIASLARDLGMVPLLNDPPRERIEGHSGFVSLDDIRETADIISLHVPLTFPGPDKTYHLVDNNFLQKLGKKPFLINTSRGQVIETQAILKHLDKGTINGFVADVWENEPWLDMELMKRAAIATPHIAGYSIEGKANGTAACVRAASHFFQFSIDDWYPRILPQPANPYIKLQAEGKTNEQVIAEVILSTYDIMQDDNALRNTPSQFERLRNFYPTRREPGAFTLKIKGHRPDLMGSLSSIGYVIT